MQTINITTNWLFDDDEKLVMQIESILRYNFRCCENILKRCVSSFCDAKTDFVINGMVTVNRHIVDVNVNVYADLCDDAGENFFQKIIIETISKTFVDLKNLFEIPANFQCDQFNTYSTFSSDCGGGFLIHLNKE